MTRDDSAQASLRELFDAARAAWPGVAVEFETFAARVGNHDAHTGAAAHASDLYLACACAQADELALGEFERRHLASVCAAVARIDDSADFVAEVLQSLRTRLFVGDAAKIREYRGSGPLAGWVRTAAVRTALNLRRVRMREPPPDDAVQLAPLLDPEAALLRERHRNDVVCSLRNALAQLAPEQRVLLRWTYLDRLTLARIGALQGVSAPTVHRRLAAAMSALIAAVRSELTLRLQLSEASLDSLIRGVDADMDLSLSQLFQDS